MRYKNLASLVAAYASGELHEDWCVHIGHDMARVSAPWSKQLARCSIIEYIGGERQGVQDRFVEVYADHEADFIADCLRFAIDGGPSLYHQPAKGESIPEYSTLDLLFTIFGRYASGCPLASDYTVMMPGPAKWGGAEREKSASQLRSHLQTINTLDATGGNQRKRQWFAQHLQLGVGFEIDTSAHRVDLMREQMPILFT